MRFYPRFRLEPNCIVKKDITGTCAGELRTSSCNIQLGKKRKKERSGQLECAHVCSLEGTPFKLRNHIQRSHLSFSISLSLVLRFMSVLSSTAAIQRKKERKKERGDGG
jgi:hypothetical protein